MCQVCYEMKSARDCKWSCYCKQCCADIDRCTNWVYDPPNKTPAVKPEDDQAFANIIDKLALMSQGQQYEQVESMDM